MISKLVGKKGTLTTRQNSTLFVRLQTEVLDERGMKIKRDVDLEIERNHYSEPELELTLQRKLGPHSELKVKRKLYAVFQCQSKFVVELEAGLRFRWTSSTCYWYSYCYCSCSRGTGR